MGILTLTGCQCPPDNGEKAFRGFNIDDYE